MMKTTAHMIPMSHLGTNTPWEIAKSMTAATKIGNPTATMAVIHCQVGETRPKS
jgi:hypothetical protein